MSAETNPEKCKAKAAEVNIFNAEMSPGKLKVIEEQLKKYEDLLSPEKKRDKNVNIKLHKRQKTQTREDEVKEFRQKTLFKHKRERMRSKYYAENSQVTSSIQLE